MKVGTQDLTSQGKIYAQNWMAGANIAKKYNEGQI